MEKAPDEQAQRRAPTVLGDVLMRAHIGQMGRLPYLHCCQRGGEGSSASPTNEKPLANEWLDACQVTKSHAIEIAARRLRYPVNPMSATKAR